MFKVYTSRGRNAPVGRILDVLETSHFSYEVVTSRNMNIQDLKKILSLTHYGFKEIIVSKENAPKVYSKFCFDFDEISTDTMLQVVLNNPQLLKSPIIYDASHLFIGNCSGAFYQFILHQTEKAE